MFIPDFIKNDLLLITNEGIDLSPLVKKIFKDDREYPLMNNFLSQIMNLLTISNLSIEGFVVSDIIRGYVRKREKNEEYFREHIKEKNEEYYIGFQYGNILSFLGVGKNGKSKSVEIEFGKDITPYKKKRIPLSSFEKEVRDFFFNIENPIKKEMFN
jgi:hypothetical protein